MNIYRNKKTNFSFKEIFRVSSQFYLLITWKYLPELYTSIPGGSVWKLSAYILLIFLDLKRSLHISYLLRSSTLTPGSTKKDFMKQLFYLLIITLLYICEIMISYTRSTIFEKKKGERRLGDCQHLVTESTSKESYWN